MDPREDRLDPSFASHASSAADLAAKLEAFAPGIGWRVRVASRDAVPSGRIYIVNGTPEPDGPVISLDTAESTAQRVTEEFGHGDMWVEVEASGDEQRRSYVVDGVGGRTWGPVRPGSNMGWTEYGSLDG